MWPSSLRSSDEKDCLSSTLHQVDRGTALRRRQKLIIYEELKPGHIAILLLYYLLGYRQAYMLLNRKWRQRPWLCWLLSKLPVCLLSPEPLVYLRANPAGDRAFEVVEEIYKEHFLDDQRVGCLIRFFRSEDLHLAFKKSLLLELETFYYYNLLLTRISETLGTNDHAFLVPADPNVVRLYNACLPMVSEWDNSIHETRSIGFHAWSRLVSTIKDATYRLALVGYWCYGMVFLRLWRRRSGGREEVKFAITIVSPLREFSNDISGVGFLLDGQRIREDRCLFVSPLPLGRLEQVKMHQKGLRFVALDRFRFGADVSALRGMTSTILSLGASAPLWMLRTAIVSLREANSWANLMNRYTFDHLVTYCDFGIEHVARNLILRNAGVKTWYYMDTSNHYHAFCGQYRPAHRVGYWGFLLYDNYISWNRLNSDYNRLHRQRVGKYLEVGVLWSELIRALSAGEIRSERFEELKNKLVELLRNGQKIIAVFDSTYDNNTITGFRQGIAFARGIHRLLEEHGDMFAIFKEKKDPWIYPQLGWDTMGLEEEYSKLGAHPRCFMAGFGESQAAVIALADLTISFPFTSTTLEAIGAGRKGIYYDPLASYKDTFYDDIPGFVVHDFDSLKKRVVELLYSINEVEYRNHLEKYARERVDRFLDGYALSRFRGLLCEEEVNGR